MNLQCYLLAVKFYFFDEPDYEKMVKDKHIISYVPLYIRNCYGNRYFSKQNALFPSKKISATSISSLLTTVVLAPKYWKVLTTSK